MKNKKLLRGPWSEVLGQFDSDFDTQRKNGSTNSSHSDPLIQSSWEVVASASKQVTQKTVAVGGSFSHHGRGQHGGKKS